MIKHYSDCCLPCPSSHPCAVPTPEIRVVPGHSRLYSESHVFGEEGQPVRTLEEDISALTSTTCGPEAEDLGNRGEVAMIKMLRVAATTMMYGQMLQHVVAENRGRLTSVRGFTLQWGVRYVLLAGNANCKKTSVLRRSLGFHCVDFSRGQYNPVRDSEERSVFMCFSVLF